MMELSKRIEELLEKHDLSICGEITERYREKGQYDIDLETFSPEGEDVIVSLIYDGTEESFIVAFVEYANGFDAEEHTELWIDNRGKNGVPERIRDLLEDAEWIKNMLLEVAEELNNLEEKTEELESRNGEQEVKETISVEILKKMQDQSAAHALREILFDKDNKINWDKAYIKIMTNMPELISLSGEREEK